MFKSLYSGVSGLTANLTHLDVIGNNIANSNTVGFKTGRVTFNEMLTQTIRSASRPVSGGLGGTNPQQVGLGTQVGSIDTNFNQGNFQTTGKKTDLAIQGPGFFILNDGTSNVFTRAGIFGIDSENTLVNPSTGLRVQGVMADADGVLGTGPLTDIYIDPGLVVPASPTSSIEMMGNLDSASDAKGTIKTSGSWRTPGTGVDLLTALPLGLSEGDSISVTGTNSTTLAPLSTTTISVTSTMTLADLASEIQAALAAEGNPSTVNVAADGSLEVINNSGDGTTYSNMALSTSGNSTFNSLFSFGNVADAATNSSSQVLAYADETTLATDLYNNDGGALDFGVGDILDIGGTVGSETSTPTSLTVAAGTTLGDIMTQLQSNLGITTTPAEINSTGEMVITGEPGTTNAISAISITEQGIQNSALDTVAQFGTTQEAVDQTDFTMATVTYDSLGNQHNINFTFEKLPGLNEWTWNAAMDGGETITSGGSGTVSFNTNGSISNFSYDNSATGITFDPNVGGATGADMVSLTIDYGEVGALTGLTQFAGSGSLQGIADGYGTGSLVDFNIDQTGTVTGIFSNDTMRNIARIGMASFSNADGLMREANNTYRRSGNSGQPVETFAGTGNGITLVPGALETSNVDLAKEFTNLVVAQRAFQANSRVITTADKVAQELVNLVR
ncbi:MAG: flagellar hook-basal body complex protein [bacterium]|nr:flagellar hook-basal body complex protein [bacterium]